MSNAHRVPGSIGGMVRSPPGIRWATPRVRSPRWVRHAFTPLPIASAMGTCWVCGTRFVLLPAARRSSNRSSGTPLAEDFSRPARRSCQASHPMPAPPAQAADGFGSTRPPARGAPCAACSCCVVFLAAVTDTSLRFSAVATDLEAPSATLPVLLSACIARRALMTGFVFFSPSCLARPVSLEICSPAARVKPRSFVTGHGPRCRVPRRQREVRARSSTSCSSLGSPGHARGGQAKFVNRTARLPMWHVPPGTLMRLRTPRLRFRPQTSRSLPR